MRYGTCLLCLLMAGTPRTTLAQPAKVTSPRAQGLSDVAITDPADPDILTLTLLQLKIAAGIAPLDSVALDSLIAPDVQMINAGDQVFHKADIVRFLRANGGSLV